MRQNTLRIDPEIISKIYEDYISRRKGEKGKFLEEKAKELGISRYKLYKLLKSRFGLHRRNKNPHFYDIDDILYAIHLWFATSSWGQGGSLTKITILLKIR